MSTPARRRLRTTVLAVSIPLCLVLAGCSSTSSTSADGASSTGPITIALEAPLTGDQASNGQDILRGAQLAVDEANAAGGVLGRQITLVQADDKANADEGVTVANTVIDGPAVAVVGIYNSSVGLKNLPLYVDGKVVPVQMTSTDDTTGQGVTVQPKNSQISPVEFTYIKGLNAKKVALLVDPSAYTQGMADRLSSLLTADGVTVTPVAITAGLTDYTADVTKALAGKPDLVYVSTYFPEGSLIAKALAAAAAGGDKATCFMGLGNQDPAFITQAGIPASQRCVFSGVPTPDQFPSATKYVVDYTETFSTPPGVWGIFAYDSMRILLKAITTANSTDYEPVLAALKNQTVDFAGATGSVTIDPATGNRPNVPVKILHVSAGGAFVVSS